jgi:hypothetical protein
MSQLTIEEGREAVNLALSALREKENQTRLRAILDECANIADPMAQMQAKFTQLIPAVSAVLGNAFHGRDVMSTVFEVQRLGEKDLDIGLKVSKILKAIGGDLSVLDEALEEEVEEVC